MYFKHITESKMRLAQDVTVVIIGGSGALGSAIVSTKPRNARVISINRQGLQPNEALSIRFDLLLEPLEDLLEKLAGVTDAIDMVVHAAYAHTFSSITDIDRDVFLKEIELDTFIPIKLSTLIARRFWSTSQEENRAHARKVVNISSGASFGKTTRPELATYSGAKAALNVMTEYLHDELQSKYGGSAHILAPGSFSTPGVLTKTVEEIWKLSSLKSNFFSIKKI